MALDDDAEAVELLRGVNRKQDRSVAARRARETRPMSYADRRKRGGAAERTEQTNLKMKPAFKKRLIALAEQRGLSMIAYIELAVEEKAERDGE